jgi:hypothetical protein
MGFFRPPCSPLETGKKRVFFEKSQKKGEKSDLLGAPFTEGKKSINRVLKKCEKGPQIARRRFFSSPGNGKSGKKSDFSS